MDKIVRLRLPTLPANVDTKRTHEHRSFWRNLRPDSPRAFGPSACRARALQARTHFVRTGKCAAAQAARTFISIRAPLCHALSGDARREAIPSIPLRIARESPGRQYQ